MFDFPISKCGNQINFIVLKVKIACFGQREWRRETSTVRDGGMKKRNSIETRRMKAYHSSNTHKQTHTRTHTHKQGEELDSLLKATPYLVEKIHGTRTVIIMARTRREKGKVDAIVRSSDVTSSDVTSKKRKLDAIKTSSDDSSSDESDVLPSHVDDRIDIIDRIKGQERNYSVTYRLNEILQKLEKDQQDNKLELELELADFNMDTRTTTSKSTIRFVTVYDSVSFDISILT